MPRASEVDLYKSVKFLPLLVPPAQSNSILISLRPSLNLEIGEIKKSLSQLEKKRRYDFD